MTPTVLLRPTPPVPSPPVTEEDTVLDFDALLAERVRDAIRPQQPAPAPATRPAPRRDAYYLD
jgi:hypothetical protein